MKEVIALAHKWRTAKKQTAFRLLDLPSELRNQVYASMFLNIEDEVILHLIKRRKSTKEQIRHKLDSLTRGEFSVLALLMTCKQIRFEASGYAFGVMRAEIYSPASIVGGESVKSILSQILFGSHTKQLNRSMAVSGPHMQYIKNLDLRGPDAVAMLFQSDKRRLSAKRWPQSGFMSGSSEEKQTQSSGLAYICKTSNIYQYISTTGIVGALIE